MTDASNDRSRGVEELDERGREVLRAVVQEYISTGEPVGSQHLSRRPEFDVSSATLRNVLGDLEALGFLEKPHTSAGRVPTDQGYRYYVDLLVRLREPAPREREAIQLGVSAVVHGPLEAVLQEASRMLHALTQHAGVVLVPRPDATVVRRIEFVRLRDDRVLAILVGHNGQVHNRVVTLDIPMSAEELVRASNYLSELLSEVPLEAARERIRAELEREQALYSALTSRALRLGAAATELQPTERVLLQGTGSFLAQPEFSDVERIRTLLRALDEKHKLLALLDRVQRAREMQIFIGTESEFSSEGDVSVIATPYGNREGVLGTIGIIGPTRMNYQRVIPLVSYTAQVLGRALEQG